MINIIKNGKLLNLKAISGKVSVSNGDKIIITEGINGHSPKKLITKKVGHDLAIFEEGVQEPSAVLEDYYNVPTAQLEGIDSIGLNTPYIASETGNNFSLLNGPLEAPAAGEAVAVVGSSTTAAAGLSTMSIVGLGGVGVAGAAVAVGSAGGKGASASSPAPVVTIPDTTIPTATITLSNTTLKAGDTSTVTITFSEAVNNFSNDDLTLANGTLSTLTSTNNITWTATFTPDTAIENTTNVITLANTYTDTAGNIGTSASSGNYAIDTLAPIVPSLTLVTDSGSDTNDGITNVSTLNIDGIESGGTWQYRIDGGIWSNGNGTSFSATNGVHTYETRQRDSAGNESDISASLSVTINTEPTITIDSIATDNSINAIEKNTPITISGTSNAEDNQNITIKIDDAVVGTATVTGGVWSLNGIDISGYGDNNYIISVSVEDLAGNLAIHTQTVVLDTIAPNVPLIALTMDTGISNSDRITNNGMIGVSGLKTGGSWEYSIDGGSVWNTGSGSSFILSDSTYAAKNIAVRQSDAAGNISESGRLPLHYQSVHVSQFTVYDIGNDFISIQNSAVPNSGNFVVAWQWVNPITNEYFMKVQRFDSEGVLYGSSTQLDLNIGDRVTHKIIILVDGKYAVSWGLNDQVHLQLFNSDGSQFGNDSSYAATRASTAVMPGMVALANGGFVLAWCNSDTSSNYVQLFNSDGSTNGAVVQINGLYYEIAPTIAIVGNEGAYAVTWYASSDSYDTQLFNNDGTTNGSPVTTGLLENNITTLLNGKYSLMWADNEIVYFRLYDSNGVIIGTTKTFEAPGINSESSFYPKVVETADGAIAISWNTQDSNGNALISVHYINSNYTIDTVAPIVPSLTLVTDSGSDTNDGITNVSTLNINGLESGTTWQYRVDNGVWNSGYGTSFSATNGTHTYEVHQSDNAGNISDVSTSLSVTLDTESTITIDAIATDNSINTIEKNALITISGTTKAEDTQIVTIKIEGVTLGTSVVTGGVWSLSGIDLSGYGENTYIISVSVEDLAGNLTTQTQSLIIDTIAPSISTVALSSATGILNTTLNVGDIVTIAVKMNESVTVNTTNGLPSLVLNIGGVSANALYVNGSGSDTLFFSYTIQTGQNDSDGVSIGTNSLHLNGAEINDISGNTAFLTHAEVLGNMDFKVDTTVISPNIVLLTDNGANSSDGITNISTVNISGLESGALWEYRIDNGNWMSGSGTSFNTTEGTHTYEARQSDLAGNISTSNVLNITLDTFISTPLLTLLNDTGSNSSDCITNDATISVSGLESVVAWEYTTNKGVSWSSGSGSSFILSDGHYTTGDVKVHQVDIAGNLSPDVIVSTPYFASETSDLSVSNSNTWNIFDALTPVGTDGAFVVRWRGESNGVLTCEQYFNADGSKNASMIVSGDIEPGFGGGGFVETDTTPYILTSNIGDNGSYVVIKDYTTYISVTHYHYHDLMIDTIVPLAITSSAQSNDVAPIVSGTADNDATITVEIAGATYTTSAIGGAWSIDTAIATPTSGILNLNTNGNNAVLVSASDIAGNTATKTQTLMIDAAPTVIITDNRAEVTTSGAITYTFQFDENVAGFDATDIAITNTEIHSSGSEDTRYTGGMFTVVDANTYTYTITPDGGTGTLTVDVTTESFTDTVGNVNTADTTAIAQRYSIIDMGVDGKLIQGLQVEGKWYYFWDRNGDSVGSVTDYTAHDLLDGIFNQDSNGVTGGGGDTTDVYRYAIIDGVSLALPTANGGVAYPQNINSWQLGTTYTDAGASSNNSTSSYNELLAVWDAYNGVSTWFPIDGTPLGWLSQAYWSATPSSDGHAVVYMNSGLIIDYPDNPSGGGCYVALEVQNDTLAPTVIITDNRAEVTTSGAITYTFQFDENVAGFDATDIAITNTEIHSSGSEDTRYTGGMFTVVDANTYTYTITPDGGTGTLTVDVTTESFTDTVGNVNTADTTAIAQRYSIIDMGVDGKLIQGLQVEGKWYYYWDRSGNGTSADTGSLNGGVDYATHNVLDGLFNHDIDGVTNTTVQNVDGLFGATNDYRYATINGVILALPTTGTGLANVGSASYYLNDNQTYTDLAEIWDSSNTNYQASGTPAGWHGGSYWSATPSNYGHAYVNTSYGTVVANDDSGTGYIALQVL